MRGRGARESDVGAAAHGMTAAAWAAAAAARLETAGLARQASREDVAALARGLLNWNAAAWLVRQPDALSPEAAHRLDAAIARRAAREPIAYIVGVKEFYGRPFRVTGDVLIPRPDTELVVEEALRVCRRAHTMGGRPPVIVDVGTGSGCLAVTLAAEIPGARVAATDTSRAALTVARENAESLGVAPQIAFRHGSLLAGVFTPVDLIVSNPPYVPDGDRESLMPDVRDYEPGEALFAGPAGLDVIRALIPAAADVLRAGGSLVMEIGAGQAAAVEALVRTAAGLQLEHIAPDLAGIPRVVVARRR